MQTPEGEVCVICYENITCKPCHTLPECSHTFHQNCINQWFRQGNRKCPLCNCQGLGASQDTESWAWSASLEKFKHLRRLSKKKDAPKNLVKAMESIKRRETGLKNLKEEIDGWKKKIIILDGKEISVTQAIKDYKKLINKYRRRKWTLQRAKRRCPDKLNMVPVIIVEKKVID